MTFSLSLSPDALDVARSRLRSQGIPVPEADAGRIEIKGVVAEYSYSPSASTFTVKILKKPSLIPESFIEKQIREWFGSS
jgi:hypothetical protein